MFILIHSYLGHFRGIYHLGFPRPCPVPSLWSVIRQARFVHIPSRHCSPDQGGWTVVAFEVAFASRGVGRRRRIQRTPRLFTTGVSGGIFTRAIYTLVNWHGHGKWQCIVYLPIKKLWFSVSLPEGNHKEDKECEWNSTKTIVDQRCFQNHWYRKMGISDHDTPLLIWQ